MDVLVPFAAAVLSFRLASLVVRRYRAHPGRDLLLWAGSLATFALASAALAWAAAAGWDDRSFRAYYLFGGLLTAALLGAGSLVRAGRGWAAPVVLFYSGAALGVALAMSIDPAVRGNTIPDASFHLELFPARALALVGNVAGTLAAMGVSLAGIRRRPLGNGLILAGVVVAAAGSALAGLGQGGGSVFTAVAASLLYGGFVSRR
ncbi:MAG: hypothetical protein M5U27_03560 [Gaiella sp.]|nr:hypothetical protein [Gaiella sp.]